MHNSMSASMSIFAFTNLYRQSFQPERRPSAMKMKCLDSFADVENHKTQ